MSVDALIDADFKFYPYFHQLKEFEESCDTEKWALLWQQRTGKSKVTIDTACHLAKASKIDAVIVLAPNGVHANWINRELPKHHWDSVPRSTIYWDTDVAGRNKKGRTRVKAADRDDWDAEHAAFWVKAEQMLKSKERLPWFCFSAASITRPDVRNFIARIKRRRKNIMLVVDEVHDYRSPGSSRTSRARARARHCPYVRILSGTPLDNSPLHAWSQFEILQPSALGFGKYANFKAYFSEYEMQKHRNGRSYPKLVGYKNLEVLHKRVGKWSSIVTRDMCTDLPDLVPYVRIVKLSESQRSAYREITNSFIAHVDGTEISVGEATSRMVKLQQIASGFIIDEYKDVHPFDDNPRLEALVEEVQSTKGKTIIWCAFQEDMDRVVEALKKAGRKPLEYHGRVSAKSKMFAREAFAPEAENDYTDLVGHPKSGGEGLDLSGAGKIIWYSHTFDAIVRSQADERATAIGGLNIPVVDFIAAPVDKYIRDKVIMKITIADALTRHGAIEEMMGLVSL
jgi:hypothetical protein